MKQRILSAIIALIIIVPIILYGGLPFYLATSLIGIIGFRELLKLKDNNKKIPIIIKFISMISFIYIMMSNWRENSTMFSIDYESITTLLFLLLIPIIFFVKNKNYDIEDALFLIGSVFFLGISFNYLGSVRAYSLYYLIFLLLITIFTDTFAYITGLLIGKHKISVNVSPKKTWEGFIGGLIIGTFISTTFYITVFDYTGNIYILIIIVMFLSIIGQIGDLVFSSIKRHFGIKDFGNIMPGHGGILDRLDSIIFVLLAFSYLVKYI